MNYVIHTRAAFALLSAKPEATAHHISLYVALFQQWNNAHFPPSVMLVRDELSAAAHIGSYATYLRCLRDLTQWGLITYQPSQSQHRASRAIMHELTELDSEMSQPVHNPFAKPKRSPSPESTAEPSTGQAASQAVGAITKTFENGEDEENTSNFSNNDVAAEKKENGFSLDELLSETLLSASETATSKEKVALKRKSQALRSKAGGRPAPRPEITFTASELADPDAFAAAFTGTDFELANLRYYHEKVANWRKDGEPPLRRDWKSTAKNFMLNDIERNALVLAPGTNRTDSSSCQPQPRSSAFDDYVSQRYG